jgi:type II secretory pathway component PulM
VDKKSLIGLGLIALILGVWLYFSGPSKEQIARNKHIRDSIELVAKKEQEAEAVRIRAAQATDTLRAKPVLSDSALAAERNSTYRDFSPALNGKA